MSFDIGENVSVKTKHIAAVNLYQECCGMQIIRSERRSKNYYRWRRRWLPSCMFQSVRIRTKSPTMIGYNSSENEITNGGRYIIDESNNDDLQDIGNVGSWREKRKTLGTNEIKSRINQIRHGKRYYRNSESDYNDRETDVNKIQEEETQQLKAEGTLVNTENVSYEKMINKKHG